MSRMPRPRSHALLVTTVALVAGGLAGVAPGSATADASFPAPPAGSGQVTETYRAEARTIGTSREGRPITAYRVGDPDAAFSAVVLGAIHGDEQAGMRIVDRLRRAGPVAGVDLWVVPTINPDGVAHHRRGNAHGVDLNRNFPDDWAPLTGATYSGPKPLSEPEARAFRRFLNTVDPRFVVSFHQPLHGVGTSSKGVGLQKRLARGLGLPRLGFNCTGVCHGTMTSWFNARHAGAAITVEFGAHPSRRYLRGRATRATLHAVLGSRYTP